LIPVSRRASSIKRSSMLSVVLICISMDDLCRYVKVGAQWRAIVTPAWLAEPPMDSSTA
jgi:hypothetical protein